MATAKGKRATTTKKPAAKKSTGKSTSSRSKKVTKSQFPIPKPAIGIVLLALGAFALFSIISGTNATVTVFFRRIFNGMFGAVGPMVAVYMVVGGLQLILGGRLPIPKIAWLQFALLMLALVTLLQAFEISNLRSYVLQKYLPQDYYSAFVWRSYDTSAVSGGGGGYLGMLVAYPLEKYLSLTGTVMILMLAICGMIFWMVRTLAPGVLDRAGEWFAQLREDMAIRREEREAAKQEEQERRAADAALLVPLPEELMEEAPQQPANKRVATGKRITKPEQQRSAPMPQQPPPQRNTQTQMNMEWYDEPEEMPPPQEYRQPPRQMAPPPVQKAPLRPGVPDRSVKRPKLYLEEDMPPSPAEEAYTEYDAERAKFATRPSRKVEGVLPDIVLKRRAQLDDEYGTVEGFEEVSYAPAGELYTEPEAFEEEVYDDMPVEPEYEDLPYNEDAPYEEMEEEPLARPAATTKKYVIQNPADRQPQLDPETRLDRPNFRPVEEEPIHEMQQPEEEYRKPPFSLLERDEKHMRKDTREADAQGAAKLEETLKSFGVSATVIKVVHGPAITRYELQPAPGVKVAKITGLTDDIALNMAAVGVRIEAPIPGKAAVGIEIANESIETVHLRDVLESDDAMRNPSKLAVALGKDVAGKRIIADLARMPHLLIAGATGAGKSVCINTLITSIIYRATPEEVRLILVDPKKVELAVYDGIPHLLVPVVTDPKKASGALNWAVMEMDERYKLFAAKGVRDIKGYNAHRDPEAPLMPQIVVIIDELSDLMLVAPGEVEEAICRIAQLARACGIHLVIATQRPSVNVITGIIKANIPSRIAFAVSSQVDSRTILDSAGAEKLLGKGDMLFAPSGGGKPQRVQGCFVSDDEVQRVTAFVKERHETEYNQAVLEALEAREEAEEAASPDDAGDTDALFEQAVEIAIESGQASISMLQRRMRVGYARAGRIIDEMARRGIIGQADGAKPREVLMTREEFNIMFQK